MVEQNAQGGRDWNGHEHAQDSSPAEAGDQRNDDEYRRQSDRVTHHLGVDKVEYHVGDQQIQKRDQQCFSGRLGKSDQDRWHRANERSEVRNQRRDPGDQSERDWIREPDCPACDARAQSDQSGDNELATHIRVKHLADLAPDLIEVGAIVIRHQAAKVATHRRRFECEKKRDDKHEQQLQDGCQCSQAKRDGVTELTQQVLPEVRVDALRHAFEVDLDSKHADWLQAVQPILRGCGQVRELNLELIDLAYAQRHDQQDQASQRDDDRHEDHHDRENAGNAGRVKSGHGGLDQERDRRPKHERAEKVAQEEEHDDRDDEGRDAK